MLDRDLALLYGVSTKRLNEQVRRNHKRFPKDFMFQLSAREEHFLRSQIATSNIGRGGRRYQPLVFTEQGVAMLSSVLNSERAVQVNIMIMRAFVRLRQMLSVNQELTKRLDQIEKKIENHDGEIRTIFQVIRQLMLPSEKSKRRIGFHHDACKT